MVPSVRKEALLRGPLILTAISRLLLIPFYFFCAFMASNDARKLLPFMHRYSPHYFADKMLLAAGMWVFALLSVLLAWLFFTRRRAFRPLMIYFCCLYLLLLLSLYLHAKYFPPPHHHRSSTPDSPLFSWFVGSVLAFMFSSLLWPFYYAFSPRVRRVFTR